MEEKIQERAVLVGLNADCFPQEQTATEESLEELEATLPAQPAPEREVLQAVLSLPKKYRLPLYLYYYEGYSVEEVGRLIGRKASTVQTQLARGREKLRALLREEGYHG